MRRILTWPIAVLLICFLQGPQSLWAQRIDFEKDSLLVDLPYQNLLNLLSVKIPGFQISPVDRANGDMSATATLRGMNYVPSSKTEEKHRVNAPLVVIDGLIFPGSINEINLTDIASVEVINDAAAIYGSNGANGAILITTKRGRAGHPVVRFHGGAGLSGWSHRPDGGNKEWLDEISRLGLGQRYDLSVSGEVKNLNYYVSGDYTRQEGILLGDDYQKLAGLVRLEYRPLDWLYAGTQIRYTDGRQWGQTPSVMLAYWMTEPSHKYSQIPGYEDWPELSPDGKTVNPLHGNTMFDSYLYTSRSSNNHYFDRMVYAGMDLPFGLSYRISWNRWSQDNNEYTQVDPRWFVDTRYTDAMDNPDMFLDRIQYKEVSKDVNYTQFNNELRFSRAFGSHWLAARAVFEHRRTCTDQVSNSDYVTYSTQILNTIQSSRSHVNALSAGLVYQYKERYFADFAFRRDIFTLERIISGREDVDYTNNYYQAKIGWKPLKELKVYASFSDSGYEEYSLCSIQKGTIGASFSLLDDRLSGQMEFYRNYSRGNLESASNVVWGGSVAVAWGGSVAIVHDSPTSAVSLPQKSSKYTISNTGLELTLNSVNLNGDGNRTFRWESRLQLAINRNKIDSLFGETENSYDRSLALSYGFDYCYGLGAGYPISEIYVTSQNGEPSTWRTDAIGDEDPSFILNLGNTFAWKKACLWLNFKWMYGSKDHFLWYDTVGKEWTSRNFLKLSDLVFSYTINPSIRVFLSGSNLLTFTGWPGLDPENGGTVGLGPASSRFISSPTFRTVQLGVNLSLR